MKITRDNLRSGMVKEIAAISGQNVAECYQCGKCTASCPVTSAMDILPHQLLRFLQLGLTEALFSCNTIWLCASCFTCAGRCPRGIDLPGVVEALRVSLLRKRGFTPLQVKAIPSLLDKGIPEQALVSAFRKYSR